MLPALALGAWTGILVLSAPAGGGASELAQLRVLQARGQILSLEVLSAKARRLHPGILIDARVRFESRHDSYVYELYLLDVWGQVWELEFDAMTGDWIEYEPKPP